MDYILGIDQGGTKTAAAVMDNSGMVCGYGVTDGAYFPREGMQSAMERIGSLVNRVLGEASVPFDRISNTVAGITGIDWPDDKRKVTAALRETLRLDTVQAHNDCVIALFSGTQKPFGAVLCAGTGVNAAIICPDGRQFVMSDYLGDELQGGSALSYRAARKVFDADLGLLPPTKLTELFLGFTGMDTPYDMLRESIVHYDIFRKRILELVPQIISIANDGDQVTNSLLDEIAQGICDRFVAGLKKMDMLAVECDIVLTGSVFKSERNALVANITARLSEAVPLAHIVNAKYEPVVGACVMGLLQQGSYSREMPERLDISALEHGLIRSASLMGGVTRELTGVL